MSEDCDEIDQLIDTDPIALGNRCRAAETEREELREAVRQLYDAIVHGPDGCGALDPHPTAVQDYITDANAARAAATAVTA